MECILFKDFFDRRSVLEGASYKSERRVVLKLFESRLFETDIVIVVEIVQTNHSHSCTEEVLTRVKADKSG